MLRKTKPYFINNTVNFNVQWTGYPMATTNSEKAHASLVKGDPELVVTVHDLKIGDQYADLEGEDRLAWDRAWTEVKAA